MHHGGSSGSSDPRYRPGGSEGRESDSDSGARCRSWGRQWVLHLTMVALFLTSYGYDPYLRERELEQLALAADDDGVLLSVASHYHDPEQDDPGEEDIEIHYHLLLYVPRVLAVLLLAAAPQKVSIELLTKIVHFAHPVIALLYALLHIPDFLSYELRYIGCLSELFWSAKLVLYLCQLVVCSPKAERLYYLIAGALVLSLGSATQPFVAELGTIYPALSQYTLNLAIALLQVGICQPMLFCGTCVSCESAATSSAQKFSYALLNQFTVVILIATVALNSILFQCSDDLFGVFWQLFYVAAVFSTFGFLLIYLRTADLMVASFGSQFLAGVLYLYLEEPIAARFALITNSFTVATALEQLLTLYGPAHNAVAVLGLAFGLINLQPYAFFGLLLTLWSSPDICAVVVLAFNGFFALILVVVRTWLNCEPTAHECSATGSKKFATQITTIT
uniref:Uncharacterized protein n=1 Tax=Anopheles arabiensis TaxID=7173 RepID=A0A182HJ18_ANOAR